MENWNNGLKSLSYISLYCLDNLFMTFKQQLMRKFILLIFSLMPVILFSQVSLERQVIGSAGGENSAGNLSVSYTVGEAMIETIASGTLILTQGFQQPTDEAVGISIPEFEVEISAYPNPTGDVVILEIQTVEDIDLMLEIRDILGRKVLVDGKKLIISGLLREEIDFSPLPSGNYFIVLRTLDNSIVKSIKIQKVQ
jgi:Secretion system C-terminal sorting domain